MTVGYVFLYSVISVRAVSRAALPNVSYTFMMFSGENLCAGLFRKGKGSV
jgi:hypothetical protein